MFAINGGISLAIYDEKRDLMLMKTFVSVEMLKSSQIKAWKRVSNLLEQFDEFVEEGSVRYGYSRREIQEQFSNEISMLELDEINEIYGEHFKNRKNERTF